VRQLVRKDFNEVFRAASVLQSTKSTASAEGIDVLVHPSAIQTAPQLHNDGDAVSSGLDSYLQDVLTVPASLAGLPALTVPIGSGEDGWPVGVSFVGQWGSDKDILSFGRIVETLFR
jgi:aspartyl-tRNA(Asn)/glutamyl-tRNA(Gln) amidotransferase subunit A